MASFRTGLAIVGFLGVVLSTAGVASELPGPSLGVALDGGFVPDALAAKDRTHPVDVRLSASWSAVETAPGVFDWSVAEEPAATLSARGARVTLCVRGEPVSNARAPGERGVPDGAWLEGWTALLRSAVAAFGDRLSVVEIGERPELSFDPAAYAFVLKTSSLAVKAEAKARGLSVRVAQGSVGSDALAWQNELWENDAAPYADVLPVVFASGADVGSGVAAFAAGAAAHPPAAELRADVQASAADPWSSFRGAVEALSASAATALVTLPAERQSAETVTRVVTALQYRLAGEYAPAPKGRLALRAPAGGPIEGASILGRFLHAKDFATIVVYRAPPAQDPEGQARLMLDAPDVKDPEVLDLVSDVSLKTGPATVPGEKGRALRVLLADHPMAVTWARSAVNQPGLEPPAEDVRVATTRGLTAEEIIARNRQVQKIQDDHLLRWIAKGRADLHFKIAQGGGSIDVSIESTYFWRRGAKLEWQQSRYFVNGNLVTWKKIPQLPLIQPEKVLTLPLDLTFDKTYDYTLAGDDNLGGRAAYVVAFEPTADLARKSLYRGRVWIDKESFVRLRTSVLQTNLEPPVLQNEEIDTFVPVSGPDGATFALIGKIDGQQLWSGGGRNFVVRRELAFSGFDINPSEETFDQALKAAYASDDQMLRDTDSGFRYLEKRPGGERVVQEKVKTDALFMVAGAVKDDAIGGVVPLAGVNWFDYDVLKKKIQVNVFFAGVYAFANLTDPSLAGTKVDLGVEASLVALKLDDKLFTNGSEDLTQRVQRRSQYVTGRLGYPLGNFFKLAAIADLAWNAYGESYDARQASAGSTDSFVPPPNHFVYSGTVQFEFNRLGYSVTAAGTASRRSRWSRWGLYDNATGTFEPSTFDPEQRSFATWKLTAFKEWYLPKFQKIKAEIDYLGGSRLDRFSQYRFGRFGDESLEGFSGTGVRFDTGAIARTGWAFNILNAVQFRASLEFAHVADRLQDDRYRNHTGAGLSFNVVGPWKTIWQTSYGRALRSDVDGLQGKQEFLLVVLKLF